MGLEYEDLYDKSAVGANVRNSKYKEESNVCILCTI